MTDEELAAKIAEVEAQRATEDAARRAAITPHVRKAPAKTPRMSGPRYFNFMRELERNPDDYVDYRPTTFCGAPMTEVDWDRRSAVAKKNVDLVATAGVCPKCLDLARGA